MKCTTINLIEYTGSFIGVGVVKDEMFNGIVVEENDFVISINPIDLNVRINDAYKIMKNVENAMVIVV